MTKDEFANLLFRIEELLGEVDYWRRQIGECGGHCQGHREEDYRNLCPACSHVLEKEFEAIDKLSRNGEFNEALRKLKAAVDTDETGEFQIMLDIARSGTVH